MKWFVWTALDGALWYSRVFYNDPIRRRKPEYVDLKLPPIPSGKTSVKEGDVTVTLGGATHDGVSIYDDTDQERLENLVAKNIAAPDASIPFDATTTYHIIEHTDLPGDHACGRACEFRDAWEWGGGLVATNMEKARVIHMNRIKRARDVELVKLDTPYMKALEANDLLEQQRIAGLKQTLRDIPQSFDLTVYTTPETLKGAWPTTLPDRE
jgi:hypothetical protein